MATAVILILLVPLWITPLQASRLCVAGSDREIHGQWTAARDCYTHAIQMDQTNADAYAGMANTYRHTYEQTRSASDLALWRTYMTLALHWKKDIRYSINLSHAPAT
jgi:hypothetical protein